MPGKTVFDFAGAHVLVTGANGGIGRAIARLFAEAGADLTLTAHRGHQFLDELATIYGPARVTQEALDLSSPASIGTLVAAMVGRAPLDVVVHCAGVSRPAPLEALSSEAWREVMETNVRGVLLLTQGLLTNLNPGASVVAVASMAGHEPYAGMGVYSASKAALIMLIRQMAVEFAPLGIRVNAVSPGLIRTDLTAQVYADARLEKQRRSLVPAGRIGEPEDVAGVVAFLASEAAAYLTGQSILVDGGLLGTIQGHLMGRPASH